MLVLIPRRVHQHKFLNALKSKTFLKYFEVEIIVNNPRDCIFFNEI
jgi:hypothetical protein